MHKDVEKNKKKIQFKITKNIFTDFIIKEMCLRNIWKWSMKGHVSA
jgi:hypothetical protein